MMRFTISNVDVATSPDAALVLLTQAYKTQLSGLAKAATLRRGKMMEISLGPVADPANTDCNIIYRIQRQTADNGLAGGPVTPNYYYAIEGGSAPTAGSSWKINYTSEPTYANYLWTKFLNQHSGFIWYAPDDIGMPWPAVDSNGLACMARAASASLTAQTIGWEAKFDE